MFPGPSENLPTTSAGTPLRRSTCAVPSVATIRKPRSFSRLTGNSAARLSRLAIETNTVPLVGSRPYAAAWDLAKAVPNTRSKPITSPVDFISGPRIASIVSPAGVRNRWNGSTASFTAIGASGGSAPPSPVAGSRPSARNPAMVAPSAIRAAALASGTAVAFDTNGTVRLARGLASSTYSRSPDSAYCTFSSPRTPTPSAISRVATRTWSMVVLPSVTGGSAQAESPEWMPASSMCSITPPR